MTITLLLPKKQTKKGWENSPLAPLTEVNNQNKGSFGTHVVKAVLEASGESCTIISDKGDLDATNGRSEVKAAFASYTNTSVSLWWNQVRPAQGGWSRLHLVGFFADKVMVWEMTKDEFLALDDTIVTDGHVTGDADGALKEVKVRKNSKTDTISLLDEYLISTISASDVSLVYAS
jgi:hypothetical protein